MCARGSKSWSAYGVVHIHIYIYIHIHKYICAHAVYMCIYIHIQICALLRYVYMSIPVRPRAHTHSTYIDIYIYKCICMCTYLDTHTVSHVCTLHPTTTQGLLPPSISFESKMSFSSVTVHLAASALTRMDDLGCSSTLETNDMGGCCVRDCTCRRYVAFESGASIVNSAQGSLLARCLSIDPLPAASPQ